MAAACFCLVLSIPGILGVNISPQILHFFCVGRVGLNIDLRELNVFAPAIGVEGLGGEGGEPIDIIYPWGIGGLTKFGGACGVCGNL